jgi:hypothetical protein
MMSSLFSMASLYGLLGGLLIGLSAALLWVLNGRIAGITGITTGLLSASLPEASWRSAFLAGLLLAAGVGAAFFPTVFGAGAASSLTRMATAGVLVGVGTALGGGCTSGHGVCGLGRFSKRSLVATLTFIGVGMLTVAGLRVLEGAGS